MEPFADRNLDRESSETSVVDGLSRSAACCEYGIHWKTLKKFLTHAGPPGYRRTTPKRPSILEPLLPVVHQILRDDRKAPRMQRHTARRIFERLRDEHGVPIETE